MSKQHPFPIPAWRWLRGMALPALLALTTAGVAPAQAISPDREPELDREEKLRMIPGPELVREIDQDRFALSPDIERKRQSQLRELLNPVTPTEAAFRIQAIDGFLDYDEEDKIIYGPGRTRVRYGTFFLEADKVILDARLSEVQAEGNVILDVAGNTTYADSMRYNFADGEGVAFGVSGEYKPVYFRSALSDKPEPGSPPQFQKVSQHESIFRDTKVTTCDFKVPHYNIRGREVVLFDKDRIFFRGATLQIWGMPVFYLPVYTRSLDEGSPWFTQLGYHSRSGFRIRQGYAYQHQTREPSLEDDDTYETRSQGKAATYADWYSRMGYGGGFEYDYQFEFDKHKGEFELYGLKDNEREVIPTNHQPAFDPLNPAGDTDLLSDDSRWRWLWLHRSELTRDLSLVVNVDEFSDPDIFYDALDLFANEDRDRVMTRRARVAATYHQEAYVMRLMAEMKDRIGINRYGDWTNPRDDNRDFDIEPFRRLEDADADGFNPNRWGRVSEKLPQLDLATRWLPIGYRPLYYSAEIHLYNSLDKGLNPIETHDDAFVKGIEAYNALMYQWKLSERYTIVAKTGVGVGGAERDSSYALPLKNSLGYPQMKDALEFVDSDETFLVGRRRMNLDDVNHAYAWADAELSFNARFSDALTGQLKWSYRETTSDFLGDFYRRAGSLTTREDLYDYKLRQHWLEGMLNYRLARPVINLYTRAGYNLESKSELYAMEPLAYWSGGISHTNLRNTMLSSVGLSWRRRQVYDPTDPLADLEDKVGANAGIEYRPIHQRWFTAVNVNYSKTISGGVERDSDSRLTFFTDEEPKGRLTWLYGRELGPKWDTEFKVQWDEEINGLREVGWMLQRDLHDAVLSLGIRSRNDERRADARDDNSSRETDVRLGLNLKIPGGPSSLGGDRIKTIKSRYREPIVAN